MAITKILLNNSVLIDLSEDTVTTNDFTLNNSALKNDGTIIYGMAPQKNNELENSLIDGSISGVYENNRITSLPDDIFSGGDNSFNFSSNLTSVSFQNVITIGNSAFRKNSYLRKASFPNWTGQVFKSNIFRDSGLISATFPKLKNLYQDFSPYSTSLQSVDILSNTGYYSIMSTNFIGCTSLNKIILRNNLGVTPMNNINNFSNTPFAQNGAGGTLYVPSALISSYQNATNWSTILNYTNNSIQAIQGSQYETHYADGTLIPTT